MHSRCVRVIFRGRVQGVGFRYTTAAHAKHFPITGYVRNLPDRTVELVACGRGADIDGLIAKIAHDFGTNIAGQTVEQIVPSESFVGFEIRH